MNNFYIGDMHLGHKNALSFDNRPFKTIEEHDDALILNWQNTVRAKDHVYILGDFSWKNASETQKILELLPGHKHLIVGNHDHRWLNQVTKRFFEEIVEYKDCKDNGVHLVLCHYPIPCFNRHYYGAVHLYAHVHDSFEAKMMERVKYEMAALYDKPCQMFNVGVMLPYMNYTPRTLEEIINV